MLTLTHLEILNYINKGTVVLKIKKRFPVGRLVIISMAIVVMGGGAALGAMNAQPSSGESVGVSAVSTATPREQFQQPDVTSVNEPPRKADSTSTPPNQAPSTSVANLIADSSTGDKTDVAATYDRTSTHEVAPKAISTSTTNNGTTSSVRSAASTAASAQTTETVQQVATTAPTKEETSTSAEMINQTATNTAKETIATEELKPVSKRCRGLSLLGICLNLF